MTAPERDENIPTGIQFRVVEWDTNEGVPYLVVERWIDPSATVGTMPPFDGYYCGYVQCAGTPRMPQKGTKVHTNVGLVWIEYGPDSGYWIGFDTASQATPDVPEAEAITKTRSLARAVAEPRGAMDTDNTEYTNE